MGQARQQALSKMRTRAGAEVTKERGSALRRSRPELRSAMTGAVLCSLGQPAHLPARREQHEPAMSFSTLGEMV